mgnify:FL=1
MRERYGISEGVHIVWHDGYQEPYRLPDDIKMAKIVVFDGLEAAIRRFPNAEEWEQFFRTWQQWQDEAAGRTVIWVGTDITQGVVPTEREDRRWRDVVGICYQRLAAICCRVDRIWCGLAERLK